MATWKLTHAETDRTANTGDRLTDFRGNTCVLTGGSIPPHPGSTGRIYVRYFGDQFVKEFYPSVCGLRWTKTD